jgi:gluconolactonase
MRHLNAVPGLVCLLSAASLMPLFAQSLQSPSPQTPAIAMMDTKNYPVIGKIHRMDPAFDALVSSDAKLEVIASGFDWTEGPVWSKEGGFLLFSDIPRNAVMRWKEGEGVSVYLKPSGYTGAAPYGRETGSNGLTYDAQGKLVSCEHGDRRISRMEKDGGKRTVTDNYQGKRFNSPNDAVVHNSGAIYFTDPPYGLPKGFEDPRRELAHCGVYRVGVDGKVTLLTTALERPNGIAFSPDEKTLYVAQSDAKRAIWMSFPVKADGELGEGKVFFDVTSAMGKLPGAPDGLKVDQAGNLWATGPGGVYVISPSGKLLGRLETGERTANVAWGEDGSTLFLTADMFVVRVRTKTKGAGW